MALDPRHGAYHEAGHAVVHWFVEQESALQHMQMRRVDGGVVECGTPVTCPPKLTLRDLRLRLAMLWAGTWAASCHDGADGKDCDGDLLRAYGAIISYLEIEGVRRMQPPSIWSDNQEANSLLEDAREMARQIVNYPQLVAAITAVADLLLQAAPDEDGMCVVPAVEIIAACERTCGSAVRRANPWSSWLRGE